MIQFAWLNTAKSTPENMELSWSDFTDMLDSERQIKRTLNQKQNLLLSAINFCIYNDYAPSSGLDYVKSGSNAVALDLDHFELELLYHVRDNLKILNTPYVIYSTTQHTLETPRIRIILTFDRIIETKEEFRAIWTALDEYLMHLLDPATKNMNRLCYLPADWDTASDPIFEVNNEGNPLSTNRTIETGQEFLVEDANEEEIQELRTTLTDEPSWMSYQDCKHVTTDMLSEFQSSIVGGRLFKFMTRVAIRALADGCKIMPGKLADLARDVNRLVGNPRRFNLEGEAAKAIAWAENTLITNPRQNLHKLLTATNSGIVIKYREGECGSYKTFGALAMIRKSDCHWVFSCLKIDDMEQRIDQLKIISRNHGMVIHTVHSADDTDVLVVEKVEKVRKQIEDDVSGKRHLLFITHATNAIMDWSAWRGMNVSMVEDEVRDVTMVMDYNCTKTFETNVAPYFTVAEQDYGCIRLAATDKARADLLAKNFDDNENRIEYLASCAKNQNTEVWVTTDSWDKVRESRLEILILNKPTNLSVFKEIYFLGDEITKSPMFQIWEYKYGVQWVRDPDWQPANNRTIPVKDRVRIHYFSSDRKSSINWFRDPNKSPLRDIEYYLMEKHPEEPILWTASNRIAHSVKLERSGANSKRNRKDKKIRPKSHGENDHRDHLICYWACAMRVSNGEADILKRALGTGSSLLHEWREYNSLYQFVMRTNLRVMESAEIVDVYVIDIYQARYLAKRFGILEADLIFHEGVIKDSDYTGGRKRITDLGRPLTNAEMAKRSRDKKKLMAKQGAE